MLMVMAETAFAGPTDVFQMVYQSLFGSSQYEKAKAAYDSKDYATAMRLWRPLSEQGDASAQFYLGVMYQNGSDQCPLCPHGIHPRLAADGSAPNGRSPRPLYPSVDGDGSDLEDVAGVVISGWTRPP
jgi:hypothetical protein